MNLSEKFRNLLKGKYLFHLHTKYTDGLNSPDDYCSWASKNGYNAVVFTEHVRKQLLYDFHTFLSDIENTKSKFPDVDTWVGAETKILPEGQLDIPEDLLPETKIICFACHSFPQDCGLYEKSFKKLFTEKKWKKHIRVWVHPGYFLKKSEILDTKLDLLDELISSAVREGIFIEHNLKYALPTSAIIKNIPQTSLITGLDAHCVEDVVKFSPKQQ